MITHDSESATYDKPGLSSTEDIDRIHICVPDAQSKS
jgi:hypothetical protein